MAEARSEQRPVAEHARIMRAAPLLAMVPEADVRALVDLGALEHYQPDESIFREGDPGDALHTIVRGRVRIVIVSDEGREVILATLGRGDSIGELALLDGRPRSASAIAAEPTTTMRVAREDFRRWLTERPGAAVAILETLGLRLRRTNQSIADLTFLELPHRIAKRLLMLLADAQADRAGERRIRVTQSTLASMVGSSREAVNKHLRQFEDSGWVALSRGMVTVLDVDALGRFL